MRRVKDSCTDTVAFITNSEYDKNLRRKTRRLLDEQSFLVDFPSQYLARSNWNNRPNVPHQ